MTDGHWTLPPSREGFAADDALIASRAATEGLSAIQVVHPSARIARQRIAGTSCLVVEAPGARATMIYAHGGGFRMGEPGTWAGLASRLASAAHLRVVVPDYRLAPEHPFPAGLQDLVGVYRGIAASGGVAPLLGGDSAGGGLAASLALLARDAGLHAAALVLLSPWLDLRVSAASYGACAATDPIFSAEAARNAAEQYLAGGEATEPLASPLLAPSLASLPPLWIGVSSSEVLRDDALEFAGRVARESGRVELSALPNLPHVWPILTPEAAETEQAIADIVRFVSRHLPG